MVRARTQEASSLQSSCPHQGGLGEALLPVVELQQKEPVPAAQHQDLGWEEGGLAPCQAPLAFGLGILPQTGGRG